MRWALQVACATAVSIGLYAGALLFPPAAALCGLLVPFPGLVLATRPGPRACVLWLVLTASVVALAFGFDAALGFVLPFGLPAITLAASIRRSWSLERAVVAGAAAWCLGIAGVSLLAHGGVAAVAATARQELTKSVDVVLSAYASMGAPENALALLTAQRDGIVNGLLELLPALLVLTAALAVIVNLALLRWWSHIARDVNLRLWRTPDALIWVLIAAGFGMFLPAPPVTVVSKNVFVVVLGCYFCQGLAIVSYYLERFRLPRGIRIAGYVLIAVQHIITAMVLALGVFDLWGNFRRLGTGSADVPFRTDGE
jgi:uncharacterized protein YybS (DUF2232 family)